MSAAPPRPATLFLNTLAQAAPKLTGYLLSFASAPIILGGLGLRQFGIWALTGGLAQYGALLDLGIGSSVSRYVAAHQDDRRRCGEYVLLSWFTVPIVGGVLTLAAWVGAAPASHALHGISTAHLRVVMLAAVALLCSSGVCSIITAYPIGLRRMVVPNIAITLGAVTNFIASVGAIALGAGLEGYALANAGAGAVTVVIVAVMVIRADGRQPVTWPRWTTVRDLLAFSTKTQLVRVTNLVNYQTDKIVIAFSVGPSAAGAYELANRAAIAVREIGIYATSAVDVELTADMRAHGLDRVRERYGRLTAVSTAIGFPPMLLAIATAPLLLSVWLGQAPPDAAAVLVALTAAYLPAATTGVSYGVAVAAGEPGILAATAVGSAVANVVLTVALAPLFGIWGILSGTVIALALGSLAQVIAVHRRFSLPAASYLEAVAPPLRVFGALAVPVAVLGYALPIHGRGVGAAALAGGSLLYLAACAVWAARTGRVPHALIGRLPRRARATFVSTPGA